MWLTPGTNRNTTQPLIKACVNQILSQHYKHDNLLILFPLIRQWAIATFVTRFLQTFSSFFTKCFTFICQQTTDVSFGLPKHGILKNRTVRKETFSMMNLMTTWPVIQLQQYTQVPKPILTANARHSPLTGNKIVLWVSLGMPSNLSGTRPSHPVWPISLDTLWPTCQYACVASPKRGNSSS